MKKEVPASDIGKAISGRLTVRPSTPIPQHEPDTQAPQLDVTPRRKRKKRKAKAVEIVPTSGIITDTKAITVTIVIPNA